MLTIASFTYLTDVCMYVYIYIYIHVTERRGGGADHGGQGQDLLDGHHGRGGRVLYATRLSCSWRGESNHSASPGARTLCTILYYTMLYYTILG